MPAVKSPSVEHPNEPRVQRQELSPIHLLERAGEVYAEWPAVSDGDRRFTWREFRARARRFASALRADDLRKGDRVAFLAFNSEPLLLAHFAVPLAGGVLVAINTRLSPGEVAYIVQHSGAAQVFVSPELLPVLAEVPPTIQRVVLGPDFEALLAHGSDAPVESWLTSEDEPISINYTSGTTGRPKGVVYHHRGAYLNALAMVIDHRVGRESRYLWTLPMFHCNGWCFTWGLAAVGAESICIPRIEPGPTWQLFGGGVTHFCAAPTVCTMLVTDPAAHRLARPVRLFTAGAPPSPTLIARMAELNFQLDHVYGLTEVYGPFTIQVPTPGQEVSACGSAGETERAPRRTQSLRRRSPRRRSGHARRAPGWRHHGRSGHARECRDDGVFRGSGGDGPGLPWRVVPLGRPGRAARGWFHRTA